jgi:hypothetical protein
MPKQRVRVPDTSDAPVRPARRRRAGGAEPAAATREAAAGAPPDVAGLQRLVGNRAVAQLLQAEAAAAAAAPPAAVRAIQRHRHRGGHGGGRRGGNEAPQEERPTATMRVQIQCAQPRFDLGEGINEAAEGDGVTTAQIEAAFTRLVNRLSGAVKRAARDRLDDVMNDLRGRVNANTGELGRNNSTSWYIDHPGTRAFRMDVENIRGRNLYA